MWVAHPTTADGTTDNPRVTDADDLSARPGDLHDAPIRTFLIADVRGYTLFTQERGDEAAAKLAAKFAGIVRDVVESRGGTLLELRGDEALCVFGSAREAIRTAVELQERFVEETIDSPELPLTVGIGLDAGEAVPGRGRLPRRRAEPRCTPVRPGARRRDPRFARSNAPGAPARRGAVRGPRLADVQRPFGSRHGRARRPRHRRSDRAASPVRTARQRSSSPDGSPTSSRQRTTSSRSSAATDSRTRSACAIERSSA
jgi:hypothetical protein